jgi:hypothetical protein
MLRFQTGPSPALIAWRRFIFETVLCCVLVGLVVYLIVERQGLHVFLGVGTCCSTMLAILWRPPPPRSTARWQRPSD